MGGGVMRTAAKVGLAGGAAAAAAASSKGGRFRHGATAFATTPGAGAAEAAPLVSAAAGEAAYAGGRQWSSWEADGWEFADWRDDAAAVAVVEETVAVKPRLVFAPPSREEAEEATTELTDAIQRGYFHEAQVDIVKRQDTELNKLAADAIIPAMPGHVVQAFSLLKSSPEAQSVVASLASDRNVWDAVMKNDKVMEFYRTHQPTPDQAFSEETATVESPEKFGDTSLEEQQPTGSPFMDFVDNATKTVRELVDNITHFFHDIFGNTEEGQAGGSSSAEKGPSLAEMAVGGSFMALTIAVILVVLFKRA